MDNITVFGFIIKVPVPLQGVEWRGMKTSCCFLLDFIVYVHCSNRQEPSVCLFAAQKNNRKTIRGYVFLSMEKKMGKGLIMGFICFFSRPMGFQFRFFLCLPVFGKAKTNGQSNRSGRGWCCSGFV